MLAASLNVPCADLCRSAGALTHLGISCTVEGDARGLPSCESTVTACPGLFWAGSAFTQCLRQPAEDTKSPFLKLLIVGVCPVQVRSLSRSLGDCVGDCMSTTGTFVQLQERSISGWFLWGVCSWIHRGQHAAAGCNTAQTCWHCWRALFSRTLMQAQRRITQSHTVKQPFNPLSRHCRHCWSMPQSQCARPPCSQPPSPCPCACCHWQAPLVAGLELAAALLLAALHAASAASAAAVLREVLATAQLTRQGVQSVHCQLQLCLLRLVSVARGLAAAQHMGRAAAGWLPAGCWLQAGRLPKVRVGWQRCLAHRAAWRVLRWPAVVPALLLNAASRSCCKMPRAGAAARCCMSGPQEVRAAPQLLQAYLRLLPPPLLCA